MFHRHMQFTSFTTWGQHWASVEAALWASTSHGGKKIQPIRTMWNFWTGRLLSERLLNSLKTENRIKVHFCLSRLSLFCDSNKTHQIQTKRSDVFIPRCNLTVEVIIINLIRTEELWLLYLTTLSSCVDDRISTRERQRDKPAANSCDAFKGAVTSVLLVPPQMNHRKQRFCVSKVLEDKGFGPPTPQFISAVNNKRGNKE